MRARRMVAELVVVAAIGCGTDSVGRRSSKGADQTAGEGGSPGEAGSPSGGGTFGGTGGRGAGRSGGGESGDGGEGGGSSGGDQGGAGIGESGASGEGGDAGDGTGGSAAGGLGGSGGGAVAGMGGATGTSGAGSGGGGLGGGGNSGAGAGGTGVGGSGTGPCEEGATRRCCQDGTQTCSGGDWGACADAFISAESCNGVDDDCDGSVDEGLGTFRCGIGACALEVPACTDGVLATCVAAQPETAVDGCNEVDDDCDGAVDEDCPTCVHVSPTGDDAGAAASDGMMPFASVQAAIEFASSFRSAAKRVCVASGPACGATFAYQGPSGADLTMRDGVDVLGGYESTTWTRCSLTRLQPQTDRGVYFPPSIATRTVLDGFTIDSLSSTNAGVTLQGARGVLLSNLDIRGGIRGLESTDAQAEVFRSRVTGVHALGSDVSLVENCSEALGASGRCSGSCRISQVVLDNSPGSRVEGNAICGGIEIRGDGEDIVIRGNRIDVPVIFNACGGATPWLVDNTLGSLSGAVRAIGDCHPVIESNPFADVVADNLDNQSIAQIECSSDGGIASRCVVTGNRTIGTSERFTFANGYGETIGVACRGGSCARIAHNRIAGLSSEANRGGRGSWGIKLESGRVLVDSNEFTGGSAQAAIVMNSWGVQVTGGQVRIQNNRLNLGVFSPVGSSFGIVSSDGATEILSNYVFAGLYSLSIGAGNIVRNNILIGVVNIVDAGTLAQGPAPLVLQNNAFDPSRRVLARLTLASTVVEVETVSELETLLGATASGNMGSSCFQLASSPCVDAGTSVGAPRWDFEGDERDLHPDIGPDEYVP